MNATDFTVGDLLGLEPIIENEKDGTLLVLIPEGEFLTGLPGIAEGLRPVRLPAFYLAVHPVTNEQYARFLTECQPTNPDLHQSITVSFFGDSPVRKSWRGYRADERTADHPVTDVKWFGAEAYCAWAGLRLPDELEWQKGARWIDGRLYPWGGEWDPNRALAVQRGGSGDTCAVWEYPNGASRWGPYQMAGNVSEWCKGLRSTSDYTSTNFHGPNDLHEADAPPGVRWQCAYSKSGHSEYAGWNRGFRCARGA